MSFINEAKLSNAISQGMNLGPSVRYLKKEESVQLCREQRISLAVVTEKIKQPENMFTEEHQYLVLGEYAQTRLHHDLKTKTFIPAVNQFGEKFIAIFNSPSPSGFTCGYYESAAQAIPQLQQGFGYLVNDRNSQSYRLVPVNVAPYSGEFPNLEEALEKHYQHQTIKNGDEEMLARLGKTFPVQQQENTPATSVTQTPPSTPTTPTTYESEVGLDDVHLPDDELDKLLG
ncbi:hypothetical protein ACTSFT_001858 [Vibrio parahaemolyticus]